LKNQFVANVMNVKGQVRRQVRAAPAPRAMKRDHRLQQGQQGHADENAADRETMRSRTMSLHYLLQGRELRRIAHHSHCDDALAPRLDVNGSEDGVARWAP
jgi:hypothetical protein